MCKKNTLGWGLYNIYIYTYTYIYIYIFILRGKKCSVEQAALVGGPPGPRRSFFELFGIGSRRHSLGTGGIYLSNANIRAVAGKHQAPALGQFLFFHRWKGVGEEKSPKSGCFFPIDNRESNPSLI